MDLNKLKELAEKATPGPWKSGYWSGQCHLKHEHGRGVCDYQYSFVEPTDDYGWDTICMADEPIQHITTTSEYGALSRDDSSYIAALNPQVALALIEVVEAAPKGCDCGIAIGDPRISDHSTACKRLMAAQKQLDLL